MAIYAIKRSINIHGEFDLLQAWDEKWGTSCGGVDKNKALHFSESEIDEAVERANTVCVGINGSLKPEWMNFSKVEI